MSEGQLWLLVGQPWSLIDLSGDGQRDWLLVSAIGVAVVAGAYALWQAHRYSKGQMAKRLLEYLEGEAATVKETRAAVIRHLRYGEPLPKKANHPFFRDFKHALSELDRGEVVRAEQHLTGLSKVGGTYVANAGLQAATALLVLGRIANQRSDTAGAKSAWEAALRFNPEDAEAARHIGEMALALGEADFAWEQFAKAAELSPDDKLAKAETTELRARHYRDRRSPKLELGALNQCAPNFAKAGAHTRAAAAYARAGEIAAQLGNDVQAPVSLRRAFDNYRLVSDLGGMMAMRDSLDELGEDVSNLPIPFPPPKTTPFGVRLAIIALPILAAAAYLLFMLH